MATNHKKIVACPVESTIEAIGGRWKVLILHHLLDGTKRFGELSRALRGVSARTLSKQLRELERHRILTRTVHRQIPPKVEYALTPLGRALKPVLYAMHDWGIAFEKGRIKRPVEPSRP